MAMVSQKKKTMMAMLKEDLEGYPVVGICDVHKLPAKQLFEIKNKLRGKAVIKMVKKRIMKKAMAESGKKDISKLVDKIQSQPVLLFTKANPFELAQTIAKSASKAAAKAGDTLPNDIMVYPGPTSLPPGPAIGELQRVKIPVGVEGDKIVIKKEARIAKRGEKVSKELADALAKLGIEPMEISLNLLAIWDQGTVFGRDVLLIPPEHYIGQIQAAYSSAFSLAFSISYPTPATVPFLLSKAHQQAVSLAMEAAIATPATAPLLLAKARAQASALKGMMKE
jgi:large subunit ribosomal protein L10